MKYTKGPWRVISGSIYTNDGIISIGKADREERHTKPTDRDANVKLMACAPEMLEALKEVQLLISGSRFSDDLERAKVWELVDQIVNKTK